MLKVSASFQAQQMLDRAGVIVRGKKQDPPNLALHLLTQQLKWGGGRVGGRGHDRLLNLRTGCQSPSLVEINGWGRRREGARITVALLELALLPSTSTFVHSL